MNKEQALRHRRIIGVIVLAGVILSGCASPPEIERNEAGDLIPYSDLETEWSSPWIESEIVDDTHLRLTFGTGPKSECWRNNVDVIETPESVTVTLISGIIPDAERLCKDESPIIELVGSHDSIIVETESPIGDREIIDGHTPE
jgi:hypothetical protein